MKNDKTIGVVLFQLGGPDSVEAIEPFLYNLFSDPDIIDFPFAKIARKPLAKLISSNRARKVQSHYAEIGGKSPILEYTTAQACALEAEARADVDDPARQPGVDRPDDRTPGVGQEQHRVLAGHRPVEGGPAGVTVDRRLGAQPAPFGGHSLEGVEVGVEVAGLGPAQ